MAFEELTSRGRVSGGRLLMTAAATLCILLHAAHVVAAEQPANVTVREERGVYMVAARFLIEEPASVAMAVLTDYEQIPRFMPNVRTSNLLEWSEHRAVVEQEAVARFMMFSKRVHLVLEVQEDVGTIRFRDRCGKSFRHYEGTWTITEQEGQIAIAYELTAKPSFEVPAFMLKRLLRSDAAEMIERLRREITTRATSRPRITGQNLQ